MNLGIFRYEYFFIIIFLSDVMLCNFSTSFRIHHGIYYAILETGTFHAQTQSKLRPRNYNKQLLKYHSFLLTPVHSTKARAYDIDNKNTYTFLADEQGNFIVIIIKKSASPFSGWAAKIPT